MVKHWPDYNKAHMGIVIENLKRSELPMDVHPDKHAASKRDLKVKILVEKFL